MTATSSKSHDYSQGAGERDSHEVPERSTSYFFKKQSQRTWAEIDEERKNSQQGIAFLALTRELKDKWTKALEESQLDLERDLGIKDTKSCEDPTAGWEELNLMGTWAQSLVGGSLDAQRDVVRCLPKLPIWSELSGAGRHRYLTSVSEMLKLRETGQVPSRESPVFHLNLENGRYECDKSTNENLGREMIDHQRAWWASQKTAGNDTMFEIASKLAECDDESDDETLRLALM
ncbi:hypothetical protein I302_103566 [Kwoniella bestiolae CBS 10118]|uniref:Uncharacterized protein n=1 Tax=Kwoniella bestiolae CBS 10118 TaxID=1296100 RepID=A0A1B9G8R3_9TREE|nr:hypothetical protein I302_02267 [Kwoniella bestiolae CBS 10118]OCF27425.1 hypothetical protein I302_02267 [Kwoniella bestiolae CBS 10118]